MLRQHLPEREGAITEKTDRFGIELTAVVANVEGLLWSGQLRIPVQQIGPVAALAKRAEQHPAPVEAAALTGSPGASGWQIAAEQRGQAVGRGRGLKFGQ